MAEKNMKDKLAAALKDSRIGGLEYLDHVKKTIAAGLGVPKSVLDVDWEGVENRVAEHILGIDYGRDDKTAYQVLAAVPREKVKEVIYATLYGGTLPMPNKNGDVFKPLPEIEYGAPLASATINNIIRQVNKLTEYSMDYSIPKKPPEDVPFVSHEALWNMHKQGQLSRERYMREYMGMWPPEADFAHHPAQARKEDDLPKVMAMGMREIEKHRQLQTAHSPGTEMFIEAQRKARPKKLVEQAIQQNEKALAAKELEKVTEGVNWKPGHCRICGHANGCHHPRPQEPQGIEDPCEHLFLTRVKGAIATELGANMADGMTCAIYACRDCHKIVARIPMGSLPK